MKRTGILLLLMACLCCMAHAEKRHTNISVDQRDKMMWMDLSANWKRFTIPDSVAHYLDKTVECGFNIVVVDVKNTDGQVAYKSKIAPRLLIWKGKPISEEYDYLKVILDLAHARGLKVYAAFNQFAEGNARLKTGPIYKDKGAWQTMIYDPEKGIQPTTSLTGPYAAFTNPALPEVQRYEQSILCEVVKNYGVDGIMLDRCRYDNIKSDFSQYSKQLFEKYIGKKVERFPEDIYEWVKGADGKYIIKEGKWYKLWIEWRASIIYNYFKNTRAAIKKVRKDVKLAAYTGAWYPSYYEVGVNWASKNYDPSKEFDWATPNYKKYGFAELLDKYTNGNYYFDVTLDEYHKRNSAVLNETDSKALSGDHLCVEGACEYSHKLLGDNAFLGAMYVEQYEHNADQFKRAVKMNLKKSDGFMLFDIVHIILRDWWQPLKEAIAEQEAEMK